MKRLIFALLVLAPSLWLRADEPKTDKIKVLIVDGQNNHDWRATTPHMKNWLEACGRFTVDVGTAPAKPRRPSQPAKPKPDADNDAKTKYEQAMQKYEAEEAKYKEEDEPEYHRQIADFKPDFAKYDVILSNYNGDPWPAETDHLLESLLSEGKIGLVIVHAANNSFGNHQWREYDDMIALGWRDNRYGDRIIVNDKGEEVRVPKGQGPGSSHGAQHAFAITIRDRHHPITEGMPAEWLHAQDELYHGLRGPAENMHLLATAYSDRNKGGTGENEPMMWTVSYGKGRVFHTPMGHALEAMRCVGFITTLQRGTEWAATGKVTIPIPDNFPTAEKTSSVPAK
jgi:hypothetical protein